jgi:hypothetical protein
VLDEIENRALLLRSLLGYHGEMVEVDAVPTDQGFAVGVVRDDGRDPTPEGSGRLPVEQVVEAVAAPRDEHDDARERVAIVQGELHREPLDERREVALEIVEAPAGRRCARLDAHEEPTRRWIGELLAVVDVPPVARERSGDGVHDAGLVGTDQRDHERPGSFAIDTLRHCHLPNLRAGSAAHHHSTTLAVPQLLRRRTSPIGSARTPV